ncbi:MAG: glycosyltransferase [Patescibacteria group bacterium]|jgi:glycosyltransferase involved in cell wall biosynthesis/peptidoglycan/xylan/chitin deacetylase (PgdA/CDA1 family)
MRIAVFAADDFIPPVGGAEVALGEIIKRNPEIHFDLFVPKNFKDRPRIQQINNATIYRFGFAWPKFDKIWFMVLAPFYARSRHAHEPYDLAWSMMASYGGFACLFFTWFAPKIKMLLTLQEGDPPEYILKRVGIFRPLFRRIFCRANEVQAISRFLAQWGRDMGFQGTPTVIPNGVDLALFTAKITSEERQNIRQRFGFAETDVVLVTVSRLVLKNGTGDLISSLTKLPENYKALIIGFGEDQKKLEALTAEKNLTNRVVFAGRRDQSELPNLLQSSDIFVRPSLSEGLGNSFIEAMAASLPIVGTPVGGIPDFLFDGETGVFCQPSNPDSVAAAVLRIQNEDGLKQKLVENGRRLAIEKFDWTSISQAMQRLFKKPSRRGIFMFTLDTELAWGMQGDKRWTKEFEGARQVVTDLLVLLDKYKISATWAFVGQLFLSGEDHLRHAPEMLQSVRQCPTLQEIGCHSFSHPIMDDPNFKADDMDAELSNCVTVAKTVGVELRSFVYPQNRVAHVDRLSQYGFTCYRGQDQNWYRGLSKVLNKIAHVVDEYLLITPPTGLPVKHSHAPYDAGRGDVWEIPGGYFYPHKRGWAKFLPISFRSHKAISGLHKAASRHEVFHLWTHPFNLASDPKRLLQGLEEVFKEVARLRDQGQIDVMTMAQVVERITAPQAHPPQAENYELRITNFGRL